jgi:peptide chain release factor 2
LRKAGTIFDLERRRTRLEELDQQAAEPGFWSNTDAAQEHMTRIKTLRRVVEPWDDIQKEAADLLELAEVGEDDEAMMAEVAQQAAQLEQRLDQLELEALMSEPEDALPCFLYIHAGAGGTESCDWAAMLLRLYTRWAERHGYTTRLVEIFEGEEAGIRSATLQVIGEYAYGHLKAEAGVHRLVRISPFDAAKRRHTSFCAVDVYPEVDDTIEVEIRDEDLRVDTYRSSGAGGQHVNKTESAVRITHEPTGIVVSCQTERSQHKNRATAMKMLRSKLYQHFLEIQRAEQAAREGEKKDIAWGSQIRSYVFQPYQLVKDLRTGHETGNLQQVMDGDIDAFIQAYLRWPGRPLAKPAGVE